jgi:four helix bundle protein
MPSTINSYRDLKVWKNAVELTVGIHRLVRGFPRPDQFRIGDQLARSVFSIAANIAEGHGRRRPAEFVRFLDIANGSRCETETALEVCARLELSDNAMKEELLAQCHEIGRMLTGLRRSLLNPR